MKKLSAKPKSIAISTGFATSINIEITVNKNMTAITMKKRATTDVIFRFNRKSTKENPQMVKNVVITRNRFAISQ
ncbi:MAG: hypothetical protein IKW02_02255, partial [Clostridia bacterium]|nr:hypothetical protein [Clostridia bacterium]